MLRFITRRLQVKLILVIALALLIPTALIGAYSIDITTGELLKTAEAKNLQFVKSQAAAVLQFLAEGERDVLFLSQSPATRRFVGTLSGNGDNSTRTILTSQLRLFLTDNPAYNSVRVLDSTGQEVAGVDNTSGTPVEVPAANLEMASAQSFYIEAIRLAGQVYVSDLDLNRTRKKIDTPPVPFIRFSLALYAEGGGIVGVIVLKAFAEPMLTANASRKPGETTYVIDDEGNYLVHPDATKLYGQILGTGATFKKDHPHDAQRMRDQLEGTLFSSEDQPDVLQAFTSLTIPNQDNNHWTFVFEEKLNDVLGQINNARLVIIGLAAAALLIALGLAWVITRNIVEPVRHLAYAASLISRGQWDISLPILKNQDEIGELAVAFDRMSKELKSLYGSLEERVIARTSELETVAKVSAAAVAILDIDKLLETVSELTKKNFDLYNVHIFLIDETGENLVVAASPGEMGQQVLAQGQRIPLNSERSIVAKVGRTRQGLIVNDVNADALFLSNPLLPDTHSELAVPLIVANKLRGVLDLHSNQVNRFNEAELRVMAILGDQIAIAVQNAYLYKKQIETAKQLALAQQRAEQANRAKSLFLSNMSHELRTPLNVVIGYSSSMLERPTMYDNVPLPSIYAKDINLIKENGYHLIGLINDILDLSKIEAGKLELQLAPTNLIDIFRGVITTSIGLVKDKPVQIKPDFPGQLPQVKADAKRVRQIILNLMSNAIKFTDTGSVTLRACVDEQCVRIAVIDTGIGIPEKELSAIFDRFQQAHQDPNRGYGGTGLGLDISKQLCQMHGGELTVKSTVGQGSVFEFSLPITEIQETVPGTTLDELASTSKLFTGKVELPMAWTVMVFEDEVRLCHLLHRTLESAGYMVTSTSNRADAMPMALGVLPDVIFLDVNPPNFDGWQILSALKGNAETGEIPVILCTGEQDEARALALGVSIYLNKPADAVELLAAVQKIQKVHQAQSVT